MKQLHADHPIYFYINGKRTNNFPRTWTDIEKLLIAAGLERKTK